MSKRKNLKKIINHTPIPDNIDDIFLVLKKKKDEKIVENEIKSITETDPRLSQSTERGKKKRLKAYADENSLDYGIIKSKGRKRSVLSPEAPLERIDKESGLPIYKAHLLKVGEGGGTYDSLFKTLFML
jgi:hypothetical protein